jgi:CHAD domain-containing protein
VNPNAPLSEEPIGLAAWMDRVAVELDRMQQDFDSDAVHDLRVALRRCSSMADVYMALDPDPAWGEMKKAGRALFKCLGDLRDAQVMKGWIGHLAGEQDPAGIRLTAYLGEREAALRKLAAGAAAGFNRKKWRKWGERLAQRSSPAPLEDPVFQQFALERWQAARDRHRQALRNRSRVSFHRVRIGLKRFRYIVENLLPQRHQLWGEDLKLLQDALGEFHDLFVLWQTALRIGALADLDLRARWRGRIEEESRARLLVYRSRAVGKESLWPVWRAGLPRDRDLRLAAEARIRIWASYRDPVFARTLKVAGLALQLLDGLERERVITPGAEDLHSTLHTAAVLYNVGRGARKNAGKSSYKQISKTDPPLGFPVRVYRLAALVVRIGRGARISAADKHVARLSQSGKDALKLLVAILSLADAFAGKDDSGIRHLEVTRLTDSLLISAAGYSEDNPIARKLAAARYPLELACRTPILIRPLPEKQ